MTARVSLGHTGRPIKALPGLSWMLIAIFIAAIIRGPFLWIWPDLAATSYQISLLLGFIAYLWFVARYTIPLWSTRIDGRPGDRKSTRLNSSHVAISYAVFCLKKKR